MLHCFSSTYLSDQLFVKRFSADTPTCIHHVYISYSHSSVPVQEQHAAGTSTHLGRCFPKFRRESRPQRASEHLQNTIIHSKSLEKLAGNQISFLKSQTHRNQIKLLFFKGSNKTRPKQFVSSKAQLKENLESTFLIRLANLKPNRAQGEFYKWAKSHPKNNNYSYKTFITFYV